MPPQSRGESVQEDASSPVSQKRSPPPTLRPYLENLPSPSEIIPDQPTPTIRRPSTAASQSDSNTVDDGTEDIQELDDNDSSIGEDEEEFQSHYSRNSPASTEDEDEGDEMNGLHPGNTFTSQNTTQRNDRLQRVASLPTTAISPPNQRPPLPHSQSTASLRANPPPIPPPLYPPFYNRPPTPLPPSPSLTSLLRPPSILNRSIPSTRPTTPDSSDVETPLDTEAAVAHSARRAHPLPPTSPKVPTYEYYGFVLYLASSLAFIMYLLWSYLPSPFLHALGVTYYPNRWWSLAIPAWIVMLLVFIYVALTSYNVEYLTLPLGSLECMVDEAANVAVLDERGRVRKGGAKRLVVEWEERRGVWEERERKGMAANGGAGSWGKGSGGGSSRRKKGKERERRKGGGTGNWSMRGGGGHGSSAGDPANWEGGEDEWLNYVAAYGPGNDDAADMDLSWKQIWNQGTDAVMDVPIGGVCQVLYGED